MFGSFVLVNRIDRDLRPLFLPSAALSEVGGVVPQNPLARAGWSGNNLGDFWVGAKVNLTSQWRQQPVAFAVRGMVKLPTGDTASGASTGKADFALDGIVSKEINERVEVSGYGGFIVRGSPDEVETTNAFRWGFGAGFPTRKPLRFTAELEGEQYSNDTLVTKQVLTAEDGSFLPVGFISDVRSPVNLHLGLTWQGAGGVFAGAGWNWRMTMDSRDHFLSQYTNGAGDKMDLVVRVGYHPGVRIYCRRHRHRRRHPAGSAEPSADGARRAANPARSKSARRQRSRLMRRIPTAITLAYRWTAPTGTFTSPHDAADAMDGADAGGTGARDGHGRRRQGRNGDPTR